MTPWSAGREARPAIQRSPPSPLPLPSACPRGYLLGNLPDAAQIQFPCTKGKINIIKLDRQLFLMMLKRMSILSSEDYKGVIFNFKKNHLVITTTNPDLGESKEDMEIDYQGDSIEVAFNPRYLIETLSVINTEKVVVNLLDNEKPCLIEGENDDTYLSVIMPMSCSRARS